MTYQTYIKSDVASADLPEVLKLTPSVLLGITPTIDEALRDLHIHTVFDLGMSGVFDTAARILSASQNPRSTMRRFGRAASSMVDAVILDTPTAELPYEPIERLADVSPAVAQLLTDALDVQTIRDLALWPPYLAAKAMIVEAYNPATTTDPGASAPPELVPKSGEFGTERFLYRSLVMFPSRDGPDNSLNQSLFDITDDTSTGFRQFRFGALVTHAHTWSPMEVAKGHLLHSLPLAPGESTNVAVIDWSNKSAASTRQSLTESERLQGTNDRARTVSQVANAVATELQTGSSVTATESVSASGGVGGLLGLVTGNIGGSVNESSAGTHSVSTGERKINTSLSQQIVDSTQQVSSSLRSERAAVVSEISQQQSERLATRSVTNYNHMHALTVQYYEVVQIYQTAVTTQDVERCLFVPMQLIDFEDERNILRYLGILRSAALDEPTRTMLEELDAAGSAGYAMSFTRGARVFDPNDFPNFPFPLPGSNRANVLRGQLTNNLRQLDFLGLAGFSGSLEAFTVDYRATLNNVRWPSTTSWGAPGPILEVTIDLEDGSSRTIQSSASPATRADDNSGFGAPISFGEIRTIRITPNPSFFVIPAVLGGPLPTVDLELAIGVETEAAWLNGTFMAHAGVSLDNQPLFTVSAPTGLAELGELLNESRLYYSQQVWIRENPQRRVMELAPFTLELDGVAVRLVDHIQPVPVQAVGNYLVFRFTYEEDVEWATWLTTVDQTATVIDTVAVPTGGVFAEAVLGRANAAEKLDATRFFDWQDSPPPVPPAIAALKAGGRTPTSPPATPRFDAPMVGLQTPVTFPDPSGMTAMMAALTESDIFRNMSGVAVSSDAATNALASSSATSVAAMVQAGLALADTLTTLGTIMGSATSEKGLSTLGSIVNEVQKSKTAAAPPAVNGNGNGNGNGTGNGTGAHAPNDAPALPLPSRSGLLASRLGEFGLDGIGATSSTATDAPPFVGIKSIPSDVALLGSSLVTDPAFSDVTGFVMLLQAADDADLIPIVIRRFDRLAPAIDPLGKYRELVDEIVTRSAQLQNPARFLYAAEFVKGSLLPDPTLYPDEEVGVLRRQATELAARYAFDVARGVNASASAREVIAAIMTKAAELGVTNLDHVAYLLATAHHESNMGGLMTEVANGISTPTIFTRDAYFFNRIPDLKSSYNGINGNVLAGDRLSSDNIIDDAAEPGVLALWNGQLYPEAQQASVKIAARGCDFYRFIGRGLVQITGRKNYHDVGQWAEFAGEDFEANPERVTDIDVAATILVKGLRDGAFRNGLKLSDFDHAANFDATAARGIVNGDVARNGAGIRGLAQRYKTALIQFPRMDESQPMV